MNIISQWKSKGMIKCLKGIDSEKLLKMGAKKLIPAFRKAGKSVPAYRKLLKEKRVDLKRVGNEESFKRLVPIIDKTIFKKNEIAKLCAGGSLKKMKSAMVSSGFSGSFSYGLSSKKELRKFSDTCDTLLDHTFNTGKKKTFLINCVATGVKVYTGLPLAETSVRPDIVIALVKKLSSQYGQIILLGNPYFLKRVVEQGVEEGIDWKQLTVHLIMGEDWFPENFRSYLAGLLGIDFNHPEKGTIMANMGICELGSSLFQESIDTIRIRRLAQKDKKLHTALFGEDSTITPTLFHYNPYQIFLEEISEELVFSVLSPDALILLIRYASGDKGKIYTYTQVREILTGFNYQEYLPQLKLPLVAVMGRKGKAVEPANISITPEQVKTGLYSDFEVAGATTGYFRMSKHNNLLRVEIQLKENRLPDEQLEKRFYSAIAEYIKTDFELSLYIYKEFPYGMELNYEKKFRYI